MVTQQIIEGTADVPTPRVTAAAEAYEPLLHEWQRLGKECDTAKAALREAMQEDGVEHFILNAKYEITLTRPDAKVTVKTLSEE